MYQRNNEIRRLPRHFRVKGVTQCQKTRFEAKVLGLSAGRQPKAQTLKRELKSAFARRTPATLKEPEHIVAEEQQKLPADRSEKLQ